MRNEEQIGFFVRTALPPVEGVFFDGQFFDAYVFAADLIRSAQRRIILIDNYIDDSVLLTLAKRKEGVAAEIVTRHVTETLKLDLERHNRQAPRTVPLPHTAAVAFCGVTKMACRHARGHIQASAHEHRFVGAPNCETHLAPYKDGTPEDVPSLLQLQRRTVVRCLS